MYLSVNDTELYFDVEGAQLRVENDRLCTRPTIVVLHGGPGFDQAYLRPDVVAGEHDWVCPPWAARALAGGLPRATLCVVPDAGHFTFAEQPGRFRAALAELLTGARPVE